MIVQEPQHLKSVMNGTLSLPSAEKPAINLPGNGVTITDSAVTLFKVIAPTHKLFRRGNKLFCLSSSDTGILILKILEPSAARSYFEEHAVFFAWRVGRGGEPVLKPTILSEDTAQALLDCAAAQAILPKIVSVVECPVLMNNGNALKTLQKGYHPEARILVTGGMDVPDVPLKDAVNAVLGIVSHFMFQSASDKARAISALITPALKMGNVMQGPIPVTVNEANHSQSGKGLMQKIIAAVYGEHLVIVPPRRGGVGSVDESFCEALIGGRPFIQFDNFRGSLDSPMLESFMTADASFPCRVPYIRETAVDPSRFFIMLTSNGVETTRDLANRSNIIRILKVENKVFPDTLGEIKARQSYYLGCVFAIVKQWHRLGRNKTNETRHSFQEWCQTLDCIVQNICGLAPLMDGHLKAQERVSNPMLTFLRQIALVLEGKKQTGVALEVKQIVEFLNGSDLQVPGLAPSRAFDDDRFTNLLGTKLSAVFADASALTIDGYTVLRGNAYPSRQKGGRYKVNTYTFQRVTVTQEVQ